MSAKAALLWETLQNRVSESMETNKDFHQALCTKVRNCEGILSGLFGFGFKYECAKSLRLRRFLCQRHDRLCKNSECHYKDSPDHKSCAKRAARFHRIFDIRFLNEHR